MSHVSTDSLVNHSQWSTSEKVYNALILAQREMPYEFGQRRAVNENHKAIDEVVIWAREWIKFVSMKRPMTNSTWEGRLDLLLNRSRQWPGSAQSTNYTIYFNSVSDRFANRVSPPIGRCHL